MSEVMIGTETAEEMRSRIWYDLEIMRREYEKVLGPLSPTDLGRWYCWAQGKVMEEIFLNMHPYKIYWKHLGWKWPPVKPLQSFPDEGGLAKPKPKGLISHFLDWFYY